VQTDLEDQGFQVQCIIVPAAGIGAFHQRKRIWIMAYLQLASVNGEQDKAIYRRGKNTGHK
jgi:hypothetical protein